MRSNIWGHFQICITVPLITYLFHFSAYWFNWIKEHPLKEYWCKLKIDKIIYSKSQSRTTYDDSKKKKPSMNPLSGGYTYPKLLHACSTSLHFRYISLRHHLGSKASFATWSMIKEKDFSQLTFLLLRGFIPLIFSKKSLLTFWCFWCFKLWRIHLCYLFLLFITFMPLFFIKKLSRRIFLSSRHSNEFYLF